MADQSAQERGRAGILAYLLAHLGRVIEHRELREASGNQSEWARRVRELRTEYGYRILTHRDRESLKPGQYLLETDKRDPVLPRSISKETRAYVLERNGYTCCMCGRGAGDPDPIDPGRKVRLVLGHIVDKNLGGTDTADNLRAVCTNCNEGLQDTAPPKPDRLHLIRQVRRATVDDQRYVLAWLEAKFAKERGASSRE